MLELRQITKAYHTASLTQVALDGVSLTFRANEFVAILGQSGSGKTTLLNVVGGLDHFDSGDLIIDGVSTRDYRDRDWDTYRNHRIGFVFQAYNLIGHLSVLENVELALTLSGVSRGERRLRAQAALERVGLAEHARKRPSQLSGGQMQRVAIARALINDPEVVLADEPTGALDSATSIQVMDLLREVASERLVIMVTHNPELAQRYATRIVELSDGHIIADSHPYDPVHPATPEGAAAPQTRAAASAITGSQAGLDGTFGASPEAGPEPLLRLTAPGRGERQRRTRMNFRTALGLSFANLLTKKGRTLMTSFAGSIGIIGIALILALSTGVNAYIARTEEEALTSYPLSIQSAGMDLSAAEKDAQEAVAPAGHVITREGFASMVRSQKSNDLASLKRFLDSSQAVKAHTAAIEYQYRLTPRIYQVPASDAAPLVQVNPDQALAPIQDAASVGPFSSLVSMEAFRQLPREKSLYEGQFDVVAGRWPTSAQDLVLVLDSDGGMWDAYEYTLGLRPHSELDRMMESYFAGQGGGAAATAGGSASISDAAASPSPVASPSAVASVGSSASPSASAQESGGSVEGSTHSYSYKQILGTQFSLVAASSLYAYDAAHGVWTDRSKEDAVVRQAVKDGERLKVVGIVRAKDDTATLQPGLAYTADLTDEMIAQASRSEIVKAQLAKPDVDVFTGRSFADLAAQGGSQATDLDFSSLFTVNGEALRSAFTIDPSGLEKALAGVASGLGAPGAPGGGQGLGNLAGSLPQVSAKDLDLSALASLGSEGALDFSGLSLADLDLTDLATRYPQLAQVDYAAILQAAASSGAIKVGAGEYLATQVLPGIVSGWPEYAASHGTDSAGNALPVGQVLAGYLSSDPVRSVLSDALNSGQVIDSQALATAVANALEADPAFGQVAQAVGEDVAQAVAQHISAKLLPRLATSLSEAISSQVSQALGQALAQMSAQITSAVQAQMSAASSRLATVIPQALASSMKVDEKAFLEAFTPTMSQEDLAALMSTLMNTSVPTYEGNLESLGWADTSRPSQIDIYPTSFADKDAVKAELDAYNADAKATGHEDRVITYTDLVGTLMSSVTRIIDIISWMLIAFVSISLVVSSIMIAIITYISVLERRKEIGVLRAIGASKADIRHVFNAETVIEGFFAGILGVGITLLLSIPANLIVRHMFDVYPIAQLPVLAGIVLIAISVGLTVLAGILPAGKAAREDPVEALRSE